MQTKPYQSLNWRAFLCWGNHPSVFQALKWNLSTWSSMFTSKVNRSLSGKIWVCLSQTSNRSWFELFKNGFVHFYSEISGDPPWAAFWSKIQKVMFSPFFHPSMRSAAPSAVLTGRGPVQRWAVFVTWPGLFVSMTLVLLNLSCPYLAQFELNILSSIWSTH